jgi:F0F1-type ATP synthase membrane subunit b/b'
VKRLSLRGPPGAVLRLLGNLKELEAVTNKANRQVKAALAAAAERRGSAEPLLDRALATLEHLNEVADAILSQLGE